MDGKLFAQPPTITFIVMSTKTINITYWVLTALLGRRWLWRSYQATGRHRCIETPGLSRLSYGDNGHCQTAWGNSDIAKQIKYKAVKEWAYAGFSFTFFGAIASRAFAGDAIGEFIPPIIMLVFLFVTYYFWKKYNQSKPTE